MGREARLRLWWRFGGLSRNWAHKMTVVRKPDHSCAECAGATAGPRSRFRLLAVRSILLVPALLSISRLTSGTVSSIKVAGIIGIAQPLK